MNTYAPAANVRNVALTIQLHAEGPAALDGTLNRFLHEMRARGVARDSFCVCEPEPDETTIWVDLYSTTPAR